MSESLIGGSLGRYRIEQLLGRGGMATVFRALDPVFGRTVAIKILSTALAHDPHYAERFQREARSMAQLQHPHILPVHDVGEHDGIVYLVMQCVEGGNLRDLLDAQWKSGNQQFARSVAILEAVGGALDYAHSRGVIHRDVKPQNILLTEQGYPYLTDFGIAKIVNPDGPVMTISVANAIIGTPEYMSPEQAQGQRVDGRADLYALGIILYEVFTGRTPFRADTDEETPISILVRHAGTTPPRPTTYNRALGPDTEAVLLRALAKRPSERYQTSAELFVALRAAMAVPGQQAAAIAPVPPAPSLTQLPTATPPPYATTPYPAAPAGTASSSSGVYPPAPPAQSGLYSQPPSTSGVYTPPPAGIYTPPPQPPESSRSRTILFALIGVAAIALAVLSFAAVRVATSSGRGTTASDLPPVTPTVTVPVVAVTATRTTPAPSSAPLAVVPSATRAASPDTGGGASTPGTGRREVLVFSSHRNDVHDSQIYIMNPDGSGQRQLTFTRGHSWGPRVSPDGKYFVFSSVAPGEHIDHTATGGGRIGQGHHEVFRAKVDGSDIVRLTNTNAWNNAWVWAPDSKSMIIASDRDGNWELYRLSVNGDQEQIVRLTNSPALDGWPSFTPDGKQIVFASDREGGRSQLYIMNADGNNVRRLTNSTTTDTLPSVSPDGRRVAYTVQSGTTQTGITSDIFVMNIDGSNSTRLTRDSVAVNTDPSWSPDGTRIVFSSDRDANSNIYMMNADGTGSRRITTDPGEDVTPFWGIIDTGSASGPASETASAWPAPGSQQSAAGSEDSLTLTGVPEPYSPSGPLAHSPTAATLPSSPSAHPSCRKRRRP